MEMSNEFSIKVSQNSLNTNNNIFLQTMGQNQTMTVQAAQITIKKDNDEIKFKVIIVGDSGVGKSCLMMRYVKDFFIAQHKVTLGTECQTKTIQLNDHVKAKLIIWDTAGQQTFRSIVRTFYRNSAAVMLVYSIINKQSFENLESWLKEVKDYAPQYAFYVLVGSHCDLQKDRKVQKREVQQFKSRADIVMSFETSAKNDINVSLAFQEIAAQSFENYTKRKSTMRSSQLLKSIALLHPKNQINQGKRQCC